MYKFDCHIKPVFFILFILRQNENFCNSICPQETKTIAIKLQGTYLLVIVTQLIPEFWRFLIRHVLTLSYKWKPSNGQDGHDSFLVSSFPAVYWNNSKCRNPYKNEHHHTYFVWLQGIPTATGVWLLSTLPCPVRLPVHLRSCRHPVLSFHADIRVVLDSCYWLLPSSIQKAEACVVEIK